MIHIHILQYDALFLCGSCQCVEGKYEEQNLFEGSSLTYCHAHYSVEGHIQKKESQMKMKTQIKGRSQKTECRTKRMKSQSQNFLLQYHCCRQGHCAVL